MGGAWEEGGFFLAFDFLPEFGLFADAELSSSCSLDLMEGI